jgi:hypothetical protein
MKADYKIKKELLEQVENIFHAIISDHYQNKDKVDAGDFITSRFVRRLQELNP